VITLRPGATRAAICKHPLLIDAGSAADVSWTYGQVLAETMTPSSVARSSASTCSGVPRAAARARACRLPHRTPCRHHLRTSSSHIVPVVTAVASSEVCLEMRIRRSRRAVATAVNVLIWAMSSNGRMSSFGRCPQTGGCPHLGDVLKRAKVLIWAMSSNGRRSSFGRCPQTGECPQLAGDEVRR
jgi:hypothetical protein